MNYQRIFLYQWLLKKIVAIRKKEEKTPVVYSSERRGGCALKVTYRSSPILLTYGANHLFQRANY